MNFSETNMTSDNPWLQSAQQFQQSAMQQWTQMLQSAQASGTPTPSFAMPSGANLSELFGKITGQPVKFDPEKWVEIQQTYMKDLAELWNQGLQVKPPKDRRFASEAWNNNPMAAFSAAAYLLNARTLMAMAEAGYRVMFEHTFVIMAESDLDALMGSSCKNSNPAIRTVI